MLLTHYQKVKDELKQLMAYSGVKIVDEKAGAFNNLEKYELLGEAGSWKMRTVIFFSDNGLTYTFQYQSQEEFFIIFYNDFDKIINSFTTQKK